MGNKRGSKNTVGMLLILWVLGFSAIGAEKFEYPAEDFSDDKTYRVLSVTDGDTIRIEYEGKSEAIRLIGVDTPGDGASKSSCRAIWARKLPHLQKICWPERKYF